MFAKLLLSNVTNFNDVNLPQESSATLTQNSCHTKAVVFILLGPKTWFYHEKKEKNVFRFASEVVL